MSFQGRKVLLKKQFPAIFYFAPSPGNPARELATSHSVTPETTLLHRHKPCSQGRFFNKEFLPRISALILNQRPGALPYDALCYRAGTKQILQPSTGRDRECLFHLICDTDVTVKPGSVLLDINLHCSVIVVLVGKDRAVGGGCFLWAGRGREMICFEGKTLRSQRS